MYKVEEGKYNIVHPLLESNNELSVFSVTQGSMPGKIFVNDPNHPTAALIQTSECNLLCGDVHDAEFNASLSSELDFWDPVTPDAQKWDAVIPQIHKNRFIRKYTRRRYILNAESKISFTYNLPEGYYVEPVIPENLRCNHYENADKLLAWIDAWGSDEAFCTYGAGCYVRKEKVIVSWSISDCFFRDRIAIGVHTDARYRRKGFGIISVEETIKLCFSKGYKAIEWLCVDSNKGSVKVAEKLGFALAGKYDAFTSYPPIENPADLSEKEWNDWGAYLEKASESEPRLLTECLFAYIKANNVNKANTLLAIHRERKPVEHNIKGFIHYLHTIGMATHFHENWPDTV